MNDIRILYSFPRRLGVPGIGMTGWYQVSGLLHEGVHVELYCGSLEKPIEQLTKFKQTLVPFGIKMPIKLLGRNGTLRIHDRNVSHSLKHIFRESQIDIVHCWPSGSLETLKTARELGIKTVLERPSAHTRFVYEITMRECDRLGIKLNKHYSRYDEKILAREEREFSLADKLLCPSKHVMKTFLERGFNENQLLLGRRGYDPDLFSIPLLPNNKNAHRQFTIVYVGECHPLKGLHFALRAWSQSEASKRGRFYICGNFVPEYRDVLNPLLSHPSVEYIRFTQDVAKIMQQCDALVLPSLSEGFGKVTCEARACGCVPLVSDAADEACEHNVNGLVHKAGDVDTLSQHINMLASNRALLEQLRRNSLASISQFTWSECAKKLLNAYRECLDMV